MLWGAFSSRGYAVAFTNTLIGPGDAAGEALSEIADSLLIVPILKFDREQFKTDR